jgi:hypothetical protein
MKRTRATCPKCGARFAVDASRAVEDDVLYLYCSKDPSLLVIDLLDIELLGISANFNRSDPEIVQRITRLVEPRVVRCPCCGEFKFANLLHCPKCRHAVAGGYFEEPNYYAIVGKARVVRGASAWKPKTREALKTRRRRHHVDMDRKDFGLEASRARVESAFSTLLKDHDFHTPEERVSWRMSSGSIELRSSGLLIRVTFQRGLPNVELASPLRPETWFAVESLVHAVTTHPPPSKMVWSMADDAELITRNLSVLETSLKPAHFENTREKYEAISEPSRGRGR